MMKSIEEFFTKEQIIYINDHIKLFGKKPTDKVRMNLGMETLWYVSMYENALDGIDPTASELIEKIDNPVTGLDISIWQNLLEARKELFGVDFIRECCLYATWIAYCNDRDIIQSLRAMHKKEEKPKKLTIKKKRKSKVVNK